MVESDVIQKRATGYTGIGGHKREEADGPTGYRKIHTRSDWMEERIGW
jgi:hypothetical protein